MAKPTYFDCKEDFGFIKKGNNLALLENVNSDNIDEYLNATKGASQIADLETYRVMVDPDRAVARFAGSTESSFYPSHINISRTRPDRMHLLQISRRTLKFTVRAIYLGRNGFVIRSWGECKPIPLDPANAI